MTNPNPLPDQAHAVRASLLHCVADPGNDGDAAASEYFDDGLLVIEAGRIASFGPANELLPALPPGIPVTHYEDKLVVPGFIDCHVHYPQLDIIGSHGEQLLDWLDDYAYPAEMRFADRAYAETVAELFINELLRNGTTTALVFATVHAHTVDAVLGAAERRDMRLIAGKVLMDQDCPASLRDDPQSGYRDSAALIERWHGRGRLGYAITPRFALTSSAEQLALAGKLAGEHPDVWVQTHISENAAEIEAVRRAFDWSRDYLDVYERFGLMRDRTVLAHCLHLSDGERQRMASAGASAAHCPSSNLFLGSGLFDLAEMSDAGITVGLATDVGAGTSLSMLATMRASYEVLQLRQQVLSPCRALYLATLGAARALHLDDRIGNFETGKEADFVVLDAAATPLLEHRTRGTQSAEDVLFALITTGDDRHVHATWIHGQQAR